MAVHTLSVFIGTQGSTLLSQLRACRSSICVLDFEIQDLLRQALPAFTVDEFSELLKFTYCEFRQVLNPSFEIILEKASREREVLLLELKEKFESAIEQQLAELYYQRHMQESDLSNSLCNLPSVVNGVSVSALRGSAVSSLAVVLGAGPSLEQYLSWLRKNRNSHILISPGSIARKLLAAGIKPDFIVEMDERSWKHWQGYDEILDIPLIADVRTSPAVSGCFKKVYWTSSEGLFAWEQSSLLKDYFKREDSWSQQSNTGALALAVALHMGCDRVYLCGVDLCVTKEGYAHSSLHVNGADKCSPQSSGSVKSCGGDDVMTMFASFIDDFERLIASFPQQKVIQTSESSVRLAGADFMELNKFLALKPGSLAKTSYDHTVKSFNKEFLREVYSSFNDEIVNEDAESALFHVILKAAEYDSVLHQDNGVLEQRDLSSQAQFLESKKSSHLRVLDTIKRLVEDCDSEKEYRVELRQLFPKSEILCDSAFEVQCLTDSNNQLAENVWKCIQNETFSPQLELFFQKKLQAQLRVVKEDGTYVAYSSLCDILSKPQTLIMSAVREEPAFNSILIIGLMDAQVQLLCRQYFPNVIIITFEPNVSHLANVLRYIPLVSLVGKNSLWLDGSTEELKKSYIEFSEKSEVKLLLVDADPECLRDDLTDIKNAINYQLSP